MNESVTAPVKISISFLVEILKNMGITATVKDIKHPSPEMLMLIYREFMTQCNVISGDAFEKDHLEDAVLHFDEEVIKNQKESFSQLQLYILIKFFLDLCGLEQSYMTIFHPLKNKFPRNLNGMINFCRFMGQELNEEFAEKCRANKEFTDNCAEMKKEIEETSSKVYCINSDNMNNKYLIDECKKRVKILKDKDQNLAEAEKRYQNEDIDDKREEDALDHSQKELDERIQNSQTKFALYDKLIIKSPKRLQEENEKNDAHMNELKRLIKSVTTENEIEKKNLFEKDKFIEGSNIILEMLGQNFFSLVKSANTKNDEIESEKLKTINKNEVYKQQESDLEVLKKISEGLKTDIDNLLKEHEKRLMKTHDKEVEIKTKIKENKNELIVIKEAKALELAEIEELEQEIQMIMNNADEKIQLIRKNKEFCKSIAKSKEKTLQSLGEISNQRVMQATNKMKNGLEMFRSYEKEFKTL